jgi:putative ABC transport system permease protein
VTRTALALALFAGPLWQSKGRFVLSLAAIALGVALGFAVQLVNQSALNEFTQAVQTLSGNDDLQIIGPRAGFDEREYPRIARLPEVAVASPVVEVDARVIGRRESLRVLGLDVFRAGLVHRTSSQPRSPTRSTRCVRTRSSSARPRRSGCA